MSNGNENLAANALFSAGVSNDAPRIVTFFFAYSWLRSRKPQPSTVQPGVSAFGKNQITTRLPRNSASVRSFPFWSLTRKSGACWPTVSMGAGLFSGSEGAAGAGGNGFDAPGATTTRDVAVARTVPIGVAGGSAIAGSASSMTGGGIVAGEPRT